MLTIDNIYNEVFILKTLLKQKKKIKFQQYLYN